MLKNTRNKNRCLKHRADSCCTESILCGVRCSWQKQWTVAGSRLILIWFTSLDFETRLIVNSIWLPVIFIAWNIYVRNVARAQRQNDSRERTQLTFIHSTRNSMLANGHHLLTLCTVRNRRVLMERMLAAMDAELIESGSGTHATGIYLIVIINNHTSILTPSTPLLSAPHFFSLFLCANLPHISRNHFNSHEFVCGTLLVFVCTTSFFLFRFSAVVYNDNLWQIIIAIKFIYCCWAGDSHRKTNHRGAFIHSNSRSRIDSNNFYFFVSFSFCHRSLRCILFIGTFAFDVRIVILFFYGQPKNG